MFASLADVQELHQYISCLKVEQPKAMKLLRWAFAFYFRGWGESSEGGCICSPLETALSHLKRQDQAKVWVRLMALFLKKCPYIIPQVTMYASAGGVSFTNL